MLLCTLLLVFFLFSVVHSLHMNSAAGNCCYEEEFQLVIINLEVWRQCKSKGKVFPYSLPSGGPGADPGVQAVSPQVT